MRNVRLAGDDDVQDVVDLLNEVAQNLHDRGIDQWSPGWMSPDRVSSMIQRGETWVVHDEEQLVATVSLSGKPDPDFWTAAEQRIPALYLAKLASRRPGAGAWTARWAVEHAGNLGYDLVRLDAWRSNTRLHAWYRDQGWSHLRTMRVPGRFSGALFEHPTRGPNMVISAIRRPRETEAHPEVDTGFPRFLFEVPDARIRIPYSDAPRPLVIAPGTSHRVWHNGVTWMFGGSIGPEFASEVDEWPLLDDLDLTQEYVLSAESDYDAQTLRLTRT